RVLTVRLIAPGLEGVLRDTPGNFTGNTPMAKRLKGVSALFLGGTESLLIEPLAQGKNLRVQPLIQTPEPFWGEVDYNVSEGERVEFNEGKDHKAPLTIAATIEK